MPWVLGLAATAVLVVVALVRWKMGAVGVELALGFIVGGALSLYAFFESAGSFEGQDWGIRTVGLLAAACLGPALAMLLFRKNPHEALAGCALAAVTWGVASSVLLRPAFAAAPDELRIARSCYRGMEIYALAMVAVAAGARLGVDHFPSSEAGGKAEAYWVFPVLLLAAEALAMVVVTGGKDSALPRWTAAARGGAAGVFAVVVTAWLKQRFLPELEWDIALYGLLLVLTVVMAAMTRENGRSEEGFQPVAMSFGAALLILAVVAVAFRSLHGYGVALALIAGLPVIAAAYLSRDRLAEPVAESVALGGLNVMLLLTLNRVFLERAGKGLALDFQQHYDYFAVVLGLGACFGLMAFASTAVERERASERRGFRAGPLVRAAMLGVLMVVVPVGLMAIWGVKAANAFLIGLAFAQVTWMLLVAWTNGGARETVLAGAPHICLVAATLAATRLAPGVLALNLTRGHKLMIAAALTLVAVVWVAADGWRRSRGRGGVE